jgi:hypothetical protein
MEQRYGLRVDVQVDRHMTGDQLQLVCTAAKTAVAVEAEEVEPVEAVEAAQPHATWPEPEAPQAGWPEPQDLEPVPLTPPLASPQDRLSAAPSLEDAEAEESEDGAVPPASMVDRDAGEPPRRGWWSRFVRKED